MTVLFGIINDWSVMTYVNRRNFVEKKSAWNNKLHTVVGANDSFIKF